MDVIWAAESFHLFAEKTMAGFWFKAFLTPSLKQKSAHLQRRNFYIVVSYFYASVFRPILRPVSRLSFSESASKKIDVITWIELGMLIEDLDFSKMRALLLKSVGISLYNIKP